MIEARFPNSRVLGSLGAQRSTPTMEKKKESTILFMFQGVGYYIIIGFRLS